MSSKNPYRIEILGEDNYAAWREQLLDFSGANSLWRFLSNYCPCPGTDTTRDASSVDDEELKEWMKWDEKAKMLLNLTVSESQWELVKDCKTSHEMWMKLQKIHKSIGPKDKAACMKKLVLLKMKHGQNIRIHVESFFDILEDLTKTGAEINEDFLSVMLLNSLPDSFDDFRRGLEKKNELPSVKELGEKIIEEGIKMPFCNTPKHIQDIEQRLQSSLFMFRSIPTGKYFDAVTDAIFKSLRDQNEPPFWILDSGMPFHCCSIALKSRIESSSRPNIYSQQEGEEWLNAVTDKGKIKIHSQYPDRALVIQNILCLPAFDFNILSVQRITDMGYKVTFEPEFARVFDEDGRVVLLSYKIRNFYVVLEDTYKKMYFPYYEDKPAGRLYRIYNGLKNLVQMLLGR